MTKDNRPTQRLANYLEERAEGQTALIIQTICPWKRNDIDPDHIHELPSCYDESCIPDLQRYMIEPVHKHGGLICAQPYYVHDWKPDAETPEGPYGLSDIAILKFMGGFRAMTLEQVERRAAGTSTRRACARKPASTPSRSWRAWAASCRASWRWPPTTAPTSTAAAWRTA